MMTLLKCATFSVILFCFGHIVYSGNFSEIHDVKLHRNENLLCLILGVTVFLVIQVFKKKPRTNLPPGPYGLPIVGYIPFLRKRNIHLQLFEIGKKYGPVSSIKIGQQLYIILSNAKSMREAFSKWELTGRPTVLVYNYFEYPLITFDEGEMWLHHRRMSLRFFHELGVGKDSVQEHIVVELNDLISSLEDHQGEPTRIGDEIRVYLSNVISKLCFGRKISVENHRTLINNFTGAVALFKDGAIFALFPWLFNFPLIKWIIGRSLKIKVEDFSKRIITIIREQIAVHKNDPGNVYPCLMSMYLDDIKKNKNGSKNNSDEISLIGFVAEMYGAGITSPRMILEWCFYVMAAKPDVQLKLQNEIDKIIGNENFPQFSALKSMPYTHSFLLEVLRFYSPTPLLFPKSVLKDTLIMGYDIPKNAHVLGNLYASNRDDSWDDAENFLPERFLDPEDHTVVKKHSSYLAFSYGKRNCVGEVLSLTKIFLCIVRVLQKFDIRPSGGGPIDLVGNTNFFCRPVEQELKFIRRKTQSI